MPFSVPLTCKGDNPCPSGMPFMHPDMHESVLQAPTVYYRLLSITRDAADWKDADKDT